MSAFTPVYCPQCGEFVMDVLGGKLTGMTRQRCPNRRCRRRVWIGGDGGHALAVKVDRAPRAVAKSGLTTA